MKKCIVLVVLLMLVCIVPANATEPDVSGSPWITVYEKVSDGIVMVVVGIYKKDGKTIAALGSGSGFIVSQDKYQVLIVTNKHVAYDTDFIHIWHPVIGTVAPLDYYRKQDEKIKKIVPDYMWDYGWGRPLPPQALPYREAKIVALDKTHDLALLSVQNMPEMTVLEMADYRVKVGQNVMGIGYPLGLWLTANSGIISRVNIDLGFLSTRYSGRIVTQYDAWINGGNSGGPVFDLNGKVIGVSCASLAKGWAGIPTGMNFMVPHRFITEDLMNIYKAWQMGWYSSIVCCN